MPWDEKKTEKMRIRLTPSIAAAVRALAETERRHLQDQLGVLVEEGLHAQSANGNRNRAARRRLMTLAGAPRRTEGAA